MKLTKMPSIERVRELMNYDPLTGKFCWIKLSGNRAKLGPIPTNPSGNGYHYIGIDGRQYLAHRLAWFYVHGVEPTLSIDHINGVTTDNRIENLRAVEHWQNLANSRQKKKGRSGLKGAAWDESTRNWRAKMRVNGIIHDGGRFATPEEAHAAYCEMGKLYKGEHFNPT